MEQLTLDGSAGTLQLGSRRSPGIDGRAMIPALQAAGYGPSAIARHLNAIGAATPSGRGRWWPETVTRHTDPGYPIRNRAYMREYRRRYRTG